MDHIIALPPYLSGQGCSKHINHGNVAYIGNPAPRENE